jgi:hypothetical protein
MILLKLIELALTLLIIGTLATQILWPFCKGEPWFPILRGQRALENKLNKLHEKETEVELKSRIAELEKKLKEQESSPKKGGATKGDK